MSSLPGERQTAQRWTPKWKLRVIDGEADPFKETPGSPLGRRTGSLLGGDGRRLSDSGGGHGRRAAAASDGDTSGGGSGGLGSSGVTSEMRHTPDPCFDDESHIHSGETCEEAKSWICNEQMALWTCPVTCGYCPPFTYERMHLFPGPQVSILPSVVFTSRYEEGACHGFAKTIDTMDYNVKLLTMPAMDGEKHDKVFHCVDSDNELHRDHAVYAECPSGYGSEEGCVLLDWRLDGHESGFSHYSAEKRYQLHYPEEKYHGHMVFPEVMLDPHRAVDIMQQVSFLDAQTKDVSIAALIYTQEQEIFTSLTIEFQVTETGVVEGNVHMTSHHELHGNEEFSFLAYLTTTIAWSFLALVYTIIRLLKKCKLCRKRDQKPMTYSDMYEMFSRGGVCCYGLWMLSLHFTIIPMHTEFDHAMHAFVDMEHYSQHDLEMVIHKFFMVKELIYGTVSSVKDLRSTAFLVLYALFLQCILYFNAHPRMAILTATLEKAFSDMAHFLTLFMFLFAFLAFLAYFQFGDQVDEYKSFSDAFESQVLMIFGEFLYTSNAGDRLSPPSQQYTFYWIYAGTFLLIAFFVLLNFFLAIVVDSYVAVREDIAEFKAENSFLADVTDICANFYYYNFNAKTRSTWPRPKELISWLEHRGTTRSKGMQGQKGVLRVIVDKILCDGVDDFCRDPITAKELFSAFPSLTEDSLVTFVTFYSNKMDDDAELITAEKEEEVEEAANWQATLQVPENTPARAVLFAEVTAKYVEEAAVELSAQPDVSLTVLANKMCLKMVEAFEEERSAAKAIGQAPANGKA